MAASSTALVAQGTLPEWGRALTPAEGRELRTEIARLSRSLGVREVTLIAIARILGTNLRTISFPELIQRVATQATRAAELQTQIGALRTQLAALADSSVRGPAEAALIRATAAFNDGRLDDADREFATLESLRGSESEAARAAWLEAVDARARVAELRLDYEAAETLRLSAAREERRLSTRRQWLLTWEAAHARLRQGDLLGNNAALERAIVLFRDEVLPLAPRSERPLDWALTQNDLGNALHALGEREQGTTRIDLAIAAYLAALQEYRRDRTPADWAMSQTNLGAALTHLGERATGTTQLGEAVRAFDAALEVITRETSPYLWAVTQNDRGMALRLLGQRERDPARLEAAVQSFEAALLQFNPRDTPLEWVGAQTNRGNALAVLGESETHSRRLEQALQAYAQALAVIERERAPLRWALAQFNLANVLSILGQRESDARRLQEAVHAYEAALREYRQERVPLLWARGSNELAYTVAQLAVRTRNRTLLETADRYVREARAVLGRGGDAPGLARADYVLRAIAAIRVQMAQ